MLTFVRGFGREADCHWLTPRDFVRLPPNMRRTMGRLHQRRLIPLERDRAGENVYRARLPAIGIAGKQPLRIREGLVLAVGKDEIAMGACTRRAMRIRMEVLPLVRPN